MPRPTRHNKSAPFCTDWIVGEIFGFATGRRIGFDVYRIRNPYTEDARVEPLEGGRIYRTEADARAAIAKATGEAA